MRKETTMKDAIVDQADAETTYTRPLTPDEAAEYLQISKRTVLDLARSGEIPGCKVGGRWRFSLRQLAHYVDIGG